MADKKKRVNIKDVAALAGVSIATVSRYLNGDMKRMSQATAGKVKDAIALLNYIPNSSARQMITNSSKMIAVMVANIDDYFSSEFFKGVSGILESRGYIGTLFDVDSDSEREKRLLTAIGSQVFDGLIIQPSNGPQVIQDSLRRELPLVSVDREMDKSPWPQILTDNYDVSKRVTAHFVTEGYRHVIVVSSGIKEARTRLERYRGIQAAASSVDLIEVSEQSYQHAAVFKKLEAMIEASQEKTLIFVLKERWLLEFIPDLIYQGYVTGNEVAITGFADTDTARRLLPETHLITQSPYLMGASAAEVMLKQLSGQQLETQLIIQPAKFD